jgi:hypothetical protein
MHSDLFLLKRSRSRRRDFMTPATRQTRFVKKETSQSVR